MEGTHPALTWVVALGAGVLAQSLARHLRLPGIVVLLGFGVALGPDLLGWVEPRALGGGLRTIVDLAVAIILFEGGLNLEISRLRRAQTSLRRLVTIGALVTLVGGTAAASWILGWPLVQAVLFGSLVVVTGPTVIGPLVREVRLRPRVASILEAEGVLIDPVGAILAVLVLELALSPEAAASGATDFLLRLGLGAAVGAAGGLGLVGLFRIRGLIPEGYTNILTLAFVLLLFQACEQILEQSGILAATLAGVVVGNFRTPVNRALREFKEELTILLIGLLFVLLAADVRLADVRALGWAGVGVVAALVLVVRPLGVMFSTAGSALSWRERWLIAWLAPRGIVAAAIASVTANALEAHALPGGPELRALVFLTIAGTVLLAGLTAAPVASLLGLRQPDRNGIAILGAQGLGLALARELSRAELPVQFLDSNPQSSRRAEEAEFPVVFGNALEERTLQRARLEAVGTVVGLTANEALNGVFVRRARELFGVPERYVALATFQEGITPELLRDDDVRVLFDAPHDVERWDVRSHHGEMTVERFRFAPSEDSPDEQEAAPGSTEAYVLLCITRGARTFPMYAGCSPDKDDLASIALHNDEREAAVRTLEALGWTLEVEESES